MHFCQEGSRYEMVWRNACKCSSSRLSLFVIFYPNARLPVHCLRMDVQNLSKSKGTSHAISDSTPFFEATAAYPCAESQMHAAARAHTHTHTM